MGNWSEVDQDILSLIIVRINSLSDHIRISAVCTSWRSSALRNRHTLLHSIPTLLVSTTAHYRRQLLHFSGNSAIFREIFPISTRDRCYGSHKGWIFLVQEGSNLMYILNPLITRRFCLPCLETENVIHKAVLSSSPSEDPNCVVLILFTMRDAAFCRIGDQFWTNLYQDGCFNTEFSDALFFEDRFYAVDDHGEIHRCNLERQFIEKDSKMTSDAKYGKDKWYLVELRGEIYGVQRIFSSTMDFYFEDTTVVDDDWGFGETASLVSTKEFRVFKMDPRKSSWIRVRDLGEYSLFLGCNNSLAISESDVCGIKGNRVCFTDDRQRIKHFGFIWPGKDMGIFDLGDFSVKPLNSTQCEWLVDPPAVWVDPFPW